MPKRTRNNGVLSFWYFFLFLDKCSLKINNLGLDRRLQVVEGFKNMKLLFDSSHWKLSLDVWNCKILKNFFVLAFHAHVAEEVQGLFLVFTCFCSIIFAPLLTGNMAMPLHFSVSDHYQLSHCRNRKCLLDNFWCHFLQETMALILYGMVSTM